jgi:putative NADH-flavin reductase
MKVAVIGATGFVGNHITNELAGRNVQVLGISRNKKESDNENVRYLAVDVTDISSLVASLKGCDIVVNAFNAGWNNPHLYEEFLAGSKAILEAVKLSGVPRFITIGGAGSLYSPDGSGMQLVDTFPQDNPFIPGAKAARDYLNVLKDEQELDWAFFSPAMDMHQGITTGRTGKYRLGTDYPVMDENGNNILSGEDLAVVIADEAQNPKHHRVRFTAAY